MPCGPAGSCCRPAPAEGGCRAPAPSLLLRLLLPTALISPHPTPVSADYFTASLVFLEMRRRGLVGLSLAELAERYAVPGGRLSALTPRRIYSQPAAQPGRRGGGALGD